MDKCLGLEQELEQGLGLEQELYQGIAMEQGLEVLGGCYVGLGMEQALRHQPLAGSLAWNRS